MTTLLWLSKRSAPFAKPGRQVFAGYAGKLVLNPTSATPQFPVGTIVKVIGDGSALVRVSQCGHGEIARLVEKGD